MKRAFQRQHGLMIDRITRADGSTYDKTLTMESFGETFSKEDLIQNIHLGTFAESPSILGLVYEQSDDHRAALLESLEGGHIIAPHALIAYLDAPGVRARIIERTRTISLEHLTNFAHVLGTIGGQGATDVLHERRLELLNLGFFDNVQKEYISPFGMILRSLLRLNPDDIEAARDLVRFFHIPNRRTQRSALSVMSDVIETFCRLDRMRTVSLDLIVETFEQSLTHEDPDIFLAGLSGLTVLGTSKEELLQRCEQIYNEGTELQKELILSWSTQQSDAFQPESINTWQTRLQQEELSQHTLNILQHFGPVTPTDIARNIIAEGMDDASPTLRFHALSLLRFLPTQIAADMAQTALSDEPDEALQHLLQQHLPKK
ncbi:MAG TPA: hypothetical protein DCE42_05905 [Myxococcales bacterium]|nr:hypothetical protein [Deltaproteobacteria bacterium]MBU52477.1 hypothetical protein [Deltaproteobacteria bacterium]HAA54267.1 hypothetical protein [Myxococcales bacterium]|tara:strand:- start:29875 stop:30999 length:1125 start_codon:yes stop_codon:yes gene_type:complete